MNAKQAIETIEKVGYSVGRRNKQYRLRYMSDKGEVEIVFPKGTHYTKVVKYAQETPANKDN
jgi:hypothetical protein